MSRRLSLPCRFPLPAPRIARGLARVPTRLWLPRLTPSLQDISEEDDTRVGSSRENATGGTLSKAASNSASVTSLLSTLVPVIVYAAICILIFWCLRRRMPRVYRPRTMLTSLLPQYVSARRLDRLLADPSKGAK